MICPHNAPTRSRSRACARFCQVALVALPCLSSAGVDSIRSRAEALFERLSFLDGDGVWLLLMQTMDSAAQHRQHPQQEQHRHNHHQQQQRRRGRGQGQGQGAATRGGGAQTNEAGKGKAGRGVGGRSLPRPVVSPWVASSSSSSSSSPSLASASASAAAAAATVTTTARAAPSAAAGRRQVGGLDGLDELGGAWLWLPDPPSPQIAAFTGLSLAGGRSGRPAALPEGRSVFAGRPGRVAGECAPAAARLLDLLSAAVDEHM